MKVLDLNLLIYAVNQDSALHESAKSWLEKVLSDEEAVAFPWPVILGFLRIMTNPRIFPRPLGAGQALDIMDGWLTQPCARPLAAGEGHWMILTDLLEETGTAGNRTTDAHLAALAIEQGAELCSTDSDFARFTTLRWTNPLSEG